MSLLLPLLPGQQECWFGEKGYHESSKMESGSWADCCQSGVNPATPVYGDKPRSENWMMMKLNDETSVTANFITLFMIMFYNTEMYITNSIS